jgi:hypothetical protein
MEEPQIAACPQCDLIAKGQEEIKELFGFRKGDRPQSWCRACRIAASAKRRREIRESTKPKEEKPKEEAEATEEEE